jgi:hypothetical protein
MRDIKQRMIDFILKKYPNAIPTDISWDLSFQHVFLNGHMQLALWYHFPIKGCDELSTGILAEDIVKNYDCKQCSFDNKYFKDSLFKHCPYCGRKLEY